MLRGSGGPHVVCAFANDIIHHDREVPHNPIGKDSPSNLCFAIEYMQAFAEAKFPGTVYEGISFESDRPEIRLQVPDGGLDIQDYPVHWTLPCGRTECWSLLEFQDALPDQLAKHNSDEAYESIGREMHWDVLGCGDEGAIAAFRDDSGTTNSK